MRSYSVQHRITQIPAHLKYKQNYGISKAKELCSSSYHKQPGKISTNPDNEILKLRMNDDFTDLLRKIDDVNKKLVIEEMQKQNQMSVSVINIKDDNTIQALAIKLINKSLSEVQKLKKMIIFIG